MTPVRAKWLVPFPSRRRSEANYVAWLAAGGRGADVRYLRDPAPGDLAGYEALLLPGGADVSPERYGADAVHPRTDAPDPEEDAREIGLVHAFLGAGRPVFGICRGLQVLNVALGGKLIQHVPDRVPARVEPHKANRGDARHGLVWAESCRMAERLLRVGDTNSSHHQAIDPAAVGRGLRVAARSPAGIIEAVEGFGGPAPVVAVQWHPERLPPEHPASRGLLDWLVALASGR